jgi:hypothetical protein
VNGRAILQEAVLLAVVVLGAAACASTQCIIDPFTYPASTTIPGWSTEFGGDWVATGTAARSDIQTGWQFLVRDGVRDRDCVVEALVRYDPVHLQFAGVIARTTIESGILKAYMVKTQDNNRSGSGSFNTGYVYYYESPLVMNRLTYGGFAAASTLVRTRLLVMDEPPATVRVMAFWDTNLDGEWDLGLAVNGSARYGETDAVGLCGFSQCLVDEWKYWNACLYAGNANPRPGETLELVARSQPDRIYFAASSLFNTGFPWQGKTIPLYPDPLFVLSRFSPAIFQNYTGVFDAQGNALLRVAIPADAALVGTIFYTAFVAMSRTWPDRVEEVSNDVQVKIIS